MAAYSLAERFADIPDPCRVGNTDPGAYEITSAFVRSKENKAPFISSAPRNTFNCAISYTDSIYNAEKSRRIPGGDTPFKSKSQRFKIQAPIPEEDPLEEEVCACAEEEEPEMDKEICQGEIYRKLYKGSVPYRKSGISVPSKKHRLGYKLLDNGEAELILPPVPDNTLGPAFYRTSKTSLRCERYRGWRWRAPRPEPPRRPPPRPALCACTAKPKPAGPPCTPGPADYQHERGLSPAELCAQQFRSERARTSRQIRFMDAVIQKCRLQRNPGPADYTPNQPTGLIAPPVGPRVFISRAPRRTIEPGSGPGPADYAAGPITCGRASVLAVPFGVFQKRFTAKAAKGPGPGDYEITRFAEEQLRDPCIPHPPFGVSTMLPSNKTDVIEERKEPCQPPPIDRQVCELESSAFKSRQQRFKKEFVKYDEPSPADISVHGAWLRAHGPCRRRRADPALAPFDSSVGRFRAWRNYMSVNDFADTPGPGALDVPEKRLRDITFPKNRRFAEWDNGLPAPNQYKVTIGVDDVNKTYNTRLSLNAERGRTKLRFNYVKGRRLARRAAPRVDPELVLTARVLRLLNPELQASGQETSGRGTEGRRDPGSTRVQYRVRDVAPAVRQARRPGERVFLETFAKSHQVKRYF